MSSPHASPAPRKGRYLAVKVVMLDDTVHTFHVPQKALGQALFDGVVKKLQLLEMDYFDLEYTDMQGTQYWLDKEKPVVKQLAQSRDLTLRFLVKFYTPDPGLLEEEYTRYLYAQQIRRDLLDGMIQCQDSTAALLASFIVQADIGDFLDEEYLDHLYLKEMKFIPNQNEEFLIRVMDYHKDHVGQTPADADFNLLETARKCELYGIRMHTAKDHEDVNLNLGVAHMGVLVYQGYTKINTFSWAKIRKLSFKRKKFLIKLHPEGYGYYKDTVEFYFETRNECKNFWKKCIEYHAFFRCPNVKRIPRNKTRVVSRGSSFRYCGRTQKQLVEYVRENYVKRAPFERTTSMRTVSSMRSAGATPKTGTLNSRDSRERDYPNSGLHNTSASSGSRTLDMSHENVLTAAAARVEAADVHDDSSQSGSRSLSSPKKDHRGLQSELRNHDGSEMEEDMHEHVESQHKVLPSRSPRASRIDPSKFMLTKDDRKMSAPVFSQAHPPESIEDGKYLPRSPEIENIPERVMVNSVDRFSPSLGLSPQLKRTQSAAEASPPPPYRDIISPPVASSTIIEEPLPPPPPPIFYEDEDSKPIKMRISREMREEVVSRSTTSAASVTLTSSAASSKTEGSEDEELRRKRFAIDKAFYIAKEVLMTERTYKKDLEVITVWFRAAVEKEDAMPSQLMQLLFSSFNPLYEFHSSFLKDIEQRLAMWEGKANAHLNGEYRRLGDVMLNITRVLQLYSNYIDHHEDILTEVEQTWRKNKLFEQTYKDFEAQKVCYLPLNTFLLKPAQRLLHYRLVLQRLLQHYDQTHPDYHDCQEAFSRISEVTNASQERMQYLENLQKLIELQRDIVGIDNLVQASRQFLREGCLQKLSRKGYQQRMFFLFSDMLVYTSRTGTPALQFKVHGQLPLRGMIVEETDANMAVANSFTIYGGNRCLLVAASSPQEKDKWLEDLRMAITAAKERGEEMIKYASLKSNSSSDNLEDSHDEPRSPATPEKQIQHRANTTMHVCWHRNTSVSMRDHFIATENQLSGYLLRKFKSSNGWQKLWVVFTNFCLFFYKTYQDDYPLASLPLLGYSVSTPSDSDGIHKDFVFKLQFKNHVYFFRAESDYTFSRWVEVIRSATSSAHLTRLFSRTESDS